MSNKSWNNNRQVGGSFFLQGSDVSRVYACPKRACGISVAGSGSEPESAFLNRKSGVSEERVRVLETCRRSNSKDRSRWCVAVGSGHSFRLLLLSEAAGSSFSFLSLPSPPLFPTRRKRTFFPCHAFTHARHLCTQHAPLSYAVCICTRLFPRYEFKCDQRGGGSSFRHFSRRASNLPFLVEMDLLPREEILLLLETILFLGNFIIGLILLLFFFLGIGIGVIKSFGRGFVSNIFFLNEW